MQASCTTSQDTQCACNPGFFGNGTHCTQCKECPANGYKVADCPANSRTENITCCCKAGFFRDGPSCAVCPTGKYISTDCEMHSECKSCKSCHANAVKTNGTCTSTSDNLTCACLGGFYGDGFSCTACPPSQFSVQGELERSVWRFSWPRMTPQSCWRNHEL
jgi:hypothetical protein